MTSETRVFGHAHPRQAAMAMALELTGRSSAVVAARFGGRDDSTIRYARIIVKSRRAADPELDRHLRRIEAFFSAAAPALPEELQPAFFDGPLFDFAGASA
jgi:chromosomal replication initiation ATPase DnaA